jgi:hypothetical protein
MKEDSIVLCIMIFSILLGMCIVSAIIDSNWERWAVENGWAHYDIHTGKLILHNEDFQNNFIENIWDELKGKKPNPEIDYNEPAI